jgi:hypothetical protein
LVVWADGLDSRGSKTIRYRMLSSICPIRASESGATFQTPCVQQHPNVSPSLNKPTYLEPPRPSVRPTPGFATMGFQSFVLSCSFALVRHSLFVRLTAGSYRSFGDARKLSLLFLLAFAISLYTIIGSLFPPLDFSTWTPSSSPHSSSLTTPYAPPPIPELSRCEPCSEGKGSEICASLGSVNSAHN